MSIWSILRPFGIFYGTLVYFIVIWNIFPRFGMLCHEKSGNPALDEGETETMLVFTSVQIRGDP
jgi:hypothetical protein